MTNTTTVCVGLSYVIHIRYLKDGPVSKPYTREVVEEFPFNYYPHIAGTCYTYVTPTAGGAKVSPTPKCHSNTMHRLFFLSIGLKIVLKQMSNAIQCISPFMASFIGQYKQTLCTQTYVQINRYILAYTCTWKDKLL